MGDQAENRLAIRRAVGVLCLALAIGAAYLAWLFTDRLGNAFYRAGAFLPALFLVAVAADLLARSPIERIFAKLNSKDYDTHEKGVEEVEAILEDHWRTVLQWSTRTFPSDGVLMRIGQELLRYFEGFHPPGIIEEFEKIYDLHQGKYEGQALILRSLMNMETEEAGLAVVRLLERPSSHIVTLSWPVYIPLREAPGFGLCMLPGLMAVAPRLCTSSRASIFQVILTYTEAGVCDLADHPEFVDFCLERMSAILHPTQAPDELEKDWLDEELQVLLELSRHVFPRNRVDAILNAAREHESADGAIQVRAVCAQVERGQVDHARLETLAATPLGRWQVWLELQKIGRLDVFPKRYHNQRDLAEAEMVGWLTYPTEMRARPKKSNC